MKLCHARFLCVSSSSFPARSRRFSTCGTILRNVRNGPIIIHAVSVNKSGRLPCLRLPGRVGPFLNCHTVHVYLTRPRVFHARLHTLLHTSICNGLHVVFPVVTALGRFETTGTVLRRRGTGLLTSNMRITSSVRMNVVVRVPTTTMLTRRFTGRMSFFDVKAGSLVRCAVTTSHVGRRISCLCRPCGPTVLALVGRIVSTSRTRNG